MLNFRDAVICLMEDMTVTLYLVESTGILTELDRVKLSGRMPGKHGAIAWAGQSLAIITGDFTVRIWDIERSDNYLLKTDLPSYGSTNSSSLREVAHSFTNDSSDSTDSNRTFSNSRRLLSSRYHNDVFTFIAYCSINHTLCAGTNQGNIYTWKRINSYVSNSPEDCWQITNISSVRGAVKQCIWGLNELGKPCILINCVSNVYVLKVDINPYHLKFNYLKFINISGTTFAELSHQRFICHTTYC